jgi:hypothetical protein
MTKKPKILTRLRIDEVSSVTSGAGEGVKVVLMKRHNDTEQPRTGRAMTFHEAMAKHERAERQRNFYRSDFSKYIAGSEEDEVDDETPEPNDEENVSTLSPALEQMVCALIEANPKLERVDAVHHLLHSPSGRQLAAHIASISKGDDTMNRTEQLQKMVKSAGGITSVAKYIISKHDSLGISEPELTELINEAAQRTIKAGERPAQAFARYYSAPENVELRKAVEITKNAGWVGHLQTEYAKSYPNTAITEPRVINGADATDVNNDTSKAIEQLNALAEEQRSRSPELSFAQAFARVFSDPANSELANRAHRRPGESMMAGENRQ